MLIKEKYKLAKTISLIKTTIKDLRKIIYKKNGIIATSQQAQYLKKENILVLKGDVDLIRKGSDSLHAQRVVYLLENDEIIADSDSESQVLLNFFLDSGNTNQQPSSL